MSVIEVIEISSDEDDDVSTIVNFSLEKTEDIDVPQYIDGRITKTQPQYEDVNNTEIVDSLYLIKKLLNSNTKAINCLIEQNKFLSSSYDSISQAIDENSNLYANRYENNIVDSLSLIKIVKIESLNAQENLNADIIDSHSDNDVQEVIPDSNRQNFSNGNTNEINLENIEETTNDICHQESPDVIETSIKNEFSLFKYEDSKEISNNKHQTKIISNYTLQLLKKYLPLVRLDKISEPKTSFISSSNTENDMISVSNAENNIISSSNTENNIISSNNAENNYYCKECNRFFASAQKLRSHKQYHHDERKIYKCEQCNFASKNEANFIHHKIRHTGERPYQCFYCLLTFSYRTTYASHLFTHINNNLSCDICHAKFTKANALVKHIIFYHSFSASIRARQCKACRELFPDRYSLKIHIETHNNERSFKCNICCYTTALSQNLAKHTKKHIMNKIICRDCGRMLGNKNKFERHWDRVHKLSNK